MFGMKRKMFSRGYASVTWLCAEPLPFIDVESGRAFGVGVTGVEAAETWRRVLIFDMFVLCVAWGDPEVSRVKKGQRRSGRFGMTAAEYSRRRRFI